MPDHYSVARWGTERVVLDVVQAQHGPGAVTQRPVAGHASATRLAPIDYAAGVAAAQLVADYAHRLVGRYALKAREDGLSWHDLAVVLDLADSDEESDPATRVYEHIAPKPPSVFDPRSVAWRCATCGGLVTDHGPYNGHPDDQEVGHADTCRRHLAEVETYEQAFEEDDR